MKRVLLAGGSGQIGTYLSAKLIEKGYSVSILSRREILRENVSSYLWNVERKEIDDEAIATADYIINLAGANIGDKRWSPERKKEILDSRVESNNLLFEKVKQLNKNLSAFITSSAVGFYGINTSDKIFKENDDHANDFLGIVCDKWEKASDQFKSLGIRVVKIRTGVVLNSGPGALSKMMFPIKMFVGSPLGEGSQYVPWIHVEDLCNLYIRALENSEMEGAYNSVAPQHISNEELTKALAKKMSRPILFPNVPSIILKLILGEMSEIVLKGSRVSSDKIIETGFHYTYSNLDSALSDLINSQK